LNVGLRHRKTVARARSLAHGVGSLGIGGCAQATLRALDPALQGALLGLVELFLARLGIAKEFERPLVLLVIEVIQAITQQCARPARGCQAIDRVLRGIGQRRRIGGRSTSRTIRLARLLG
jgi:hypothetical protein